MVISVSHLSKYYKIHRKEPGIAGSIRSFFARKYEIVKAVENVSFEIDEGELVGFIGPNGAGKTTTLKCLSGLIYPEKGTISVLGFTPYERKTAFLRQIALVMGQKNQLWWDLPVIESLLLNKEIYNLSRNVFNETVSELSKLLDVEDLLNIPVKKLSLGQRMKCELIAALIHSPKVLFLDEPTIGLDIVAQKALREFIKEYNKRYKATILLTSHYMGDVEDLCKRIIIIYHGAILFDGLLLELVQKNAPYKIMNIIFHEFVDPKKLEGLGEIKSFNYPQLVLRLPYNRAGIVAAKVLNELPVEDLSIEDPDIEDVIREVFHRGIA